MLKANSTLCPIKCYHVLKHLDVGITYKNRWLFFPSLLKSCWKEKISNHALPYWITGSTTCSILHNSPFKYARNIFCFLFFAFFFPFPIYFSIPMSVTTIATKKHSSQNSHDSTTLPSLCSSISSYNSSISNTLTTQKQPRKRWDDSQFAIELCDDHLLTPKNSSNHSQKNEHLHRSKAAKNLKKKLSIKLFGPPSPTTPSSKTTSTTDLDTMATNHSAMSLHSNHSNKMSLSLKRLKTLISL